MTITKYAAALAATASIMALSSAAQAATTIWTYSGNVADGTGNASATLTEGVNSVTIDLTNLLANPISIGREISGIMFTLSEVPTGVSLFSSAGTLINIAKKGAVTASSDSIDHWGAGISSGDIFLEAAGAFAPGGKPHNLIIGPGPYTNANASIAGKGPHIDGTGTFVLNFAGLTGPVHVTGVSLAFGTSGTDFHQAICTPGSCPSVTTAVPEPATWGLMILGFGGIGAALRQRRRGAFA